MQSLYHIWTRSPKPLQPLHPSFLIALINFNLFLQLLTPFSIPLSFLSLSLLDFWIRVVNSRDSLRVIDVEYPLKLEVLILFIPVLLFLSLPFNDVLHFFESFIWCPCEFRLHFIGLSEIVHNNPLF